MTLPTLTVLLDDGTGTYPYDISRFVMAADGYEVTRGRDDWIGAVTAGQLNLTLNNSDGRFTPGSTILGTPSPIVVDQRIRLQETVTDPSIGGFGVGGFGLGGFGVSGSSSYARFTGYVKSWPVTWPATVTTFSEVHVSATDAQARAERRTLLSMLEEEVATTSPTAYFTCSEAEGSTKAGDTSGNNVPSLTISGSGVTFGTGTGPPDTGLTAVQLNGSGFLTSGLVNLLNATGWSVGVWVTVPSAPGSAAGVFDLPGTSPAVYLAVNTSGKPYYSTAVGPTSICDGLPHHLALVYDGTFISLYVDGAVANNIATSSSASFGIRVGGASGLSALAGTVSHITTHAAALSGTEIFKIYQAGMGLAESALARVIRVAGYAGIPTAGGASSNTTVTAAAARGKSAWDVIQEATDAEMGLAYVDASGTFAWLNRTFVPSKTVPDLTLSSQWVTPEVQPVVDDQQIVNYFEATAAGTGSVQTIRSASSETSHGRYPTSQTYLVQTDQEALDRANWIVANFAEPGPRYGTLTINLYGMTASQQSTVLSALDLDCWLRVTSMASQNPGGTTADVIVEGWHETVSASAWTITCNVVARSLYSPVWLLDSSHLGVDTRLYV